MNSDIADPGGSSDGESSRGCAGDRGVLFADVADSTRLYRELGDMAARGVIVAALDLGRSAIENAGGRVVEIIGDELFCLLPDGSSAVSAAIKLQTVVREARARRALPPTLAFRVGLAVGPVGLDGDHVYGDTVYLAKRVSTSAKAEQILTTRECLSGLPRACETQHRPVDRLRLKGRIDPVDLVELVWSLDTTVVVGDDAQPPRNHHQGELLLSHDGQSLVVSSQAPSVLIGRGTLSDLVIDDGRVSKVHARLELRRGGYVLVDVSRNGCLVQAAHGDAVRVVRDELPLDGTGQIWLGPDANSPEVHYSCNARERGAP